MAKTTKVLDIHHDGIFYQATYTEGDMNPYRVYKISSVWDKYGYPRKSRKLIAKYADMKSVIWHLAQEA